MNGRIKVLEGTKRESQITHLVAAFCLLLAVEASAQPGTVDTNFNAGLVDIPHCPIVQPDGRILLGATRLLTNGSIDSSFVTGLPTGATVASMALQSDGKVLIAGEFLSVQGVSRPCLARVNTNGALDMSFVPQLITTNPPPLPPPNPPRISTNSIGVVCVTPDGKILINGLYNILATNGSALPNIIRLNADGSMDTSFGITNAGTLSAIQPDGKLLVAQTLFYNPYPGSSTIRRFNTNGSIDTSFSPPNIEGWVTAIRMRDGKLIVGGNLARVNGVNCGCIAQLLGDGSLDSTFHSDACIVGQGVVSLLPRADGKIVIGGGFVLPNVSCRNFARLNADGSFDSTYVTNGAGPSDHSYVNWLAQQPDGKLLVGGEFTAIDGAPAPYFVRLNGDSSLGPGWITFESPVCEVVESAASATFSVRRISGSQGEVTVNYHTENDTAIAGTDYEGRDGILVFHNGQTTALIEIPINDDTEIEDLESFRVVLTNPSGGAALGNIRVATVSIQDNDGPSSLDPNFTVPPGSLDCGGVEAIAVQPDGKILIGGPFQQAGRVSRKGVARLNTDGSLDTTFDPGSGLLFYADMGSTELIKIQTNGQILIAGPFTAVNGTNRNHIARLNTDGSLDPTFNAGTGATDGSTVANVRELELLPDGKMIVGGGFTTFNGISRNGLARLGDTGAVDMSYAPIGEREIMPFGLQTDGKVVYAGLYQNGVSRANADGSTDVATFATANNAIFKVQSLSDGNTLIAGIFTNVSGAFRIGIARLLTSGGVDPAFVPDLAAFAGGIASPYVYHFAPQTDGKVLVALKSFRPPAANYLARLNPDGTLDADFEPVRFAIPAGDNDTISAIAIQPDRKIIVGGIFQTVNGLSHPYLVRLRGGGSSGARQLAIKSIGVLTNQSHLTLTVSAGKPFVLQTSTDLVQWISLSTNVVPVGTFTVVDSDPATVLRRFYRVLQLVP